MFVFYKDLVFDIKLSLLMLKFLSLGLVSFF